MADLVGHRLGQYQILERVSRGSTSTVYKAYQEKLDRFVAVKVLSPHFMDEEDFLERFRREAQAVARLDHPNILPVYDYEQAGDVVYIVMKYVNSGSLRELMGSPMDLRDSMEIISQVGLALGFAHKQGVIHRDVKPANILVGDNNWALLTDFGLAKILASGRRTTEAGVGMGTPDYMSPEQAQGLTLDGRADLYSLGVTLYEMLTGKTPFDGDSGIAVVVKHITEPVKPAREIDPTIPIEVEGVVMKALMKDPNQRFETAESMVAALARAVGPIGERIGSVAASVRREEILHPPSSSPARQSNPKMHVTRLRPFARQVWSILLAGLIKLGKIFNAVVLIFGKILKRGGALLMRGLRALGGFAKRFGLATIALARSTFAPLGGAVRLGHRIRSGIANHRETIARANATAETARYIDLKTPLNKFGRSIKTHRRKLGLALSLIVMLALLVLLITSGALRARTLKGALALNPERTPVTLSATTAPNIVPTVAAIQPTLTAAAATAPSGAAPAGMVLVPGGSFSMGAAGGNFDVDETPAHVVTLDSFYIDAHEVTVARFAHFANVSGYQTEAERAGDGTTWRTFNSADRQKFPVTYLTWNDAVRFCAYDGGRLPTEAEWEYAARGNTKRTYPWGATFNAAWANTVELGAGQPVAVASNSALSPFGAYDMSGNVWEWVHDWYASEYYKTSPASNPTGPATGLNKVIRGGSYKTKGSAATTTARGQASIDGRNDDIGLRCVRDQ